MRGFYTRAIAPPLLLLLVFLAYAGHAHAWSFSNVVSSIEKLLEKKVQNERDPHAADPNGGASAAVDGNGQGVTMQGRIIMVPRRSMGQCQPGQKLDRRGKCRTAW